MQLVAFSDFTFPPELPSAMDVSMATDCFPGRRFGLSDMTL